MNVFLEMKRAIDDVTDAQIDNYDQQQLKPATENEKIVGPVESREVRRVFVAAHMVTLQAVMAKIGAELKGDGLRDAEAERFRSKYLAETLRDAFWFEALNDLAFWSRAAEEDYSGLSLRSGWQVTKIDKPKLPSFSELLGGFGGGRE